MRNYNLPKILLFDNPEGDNETTKCRQNITIKYFKKEERHGTK